jgi:hypothetical protein
MLMNQKTVEPRTQIMNVIDLRKRLLQSSTIGRRVFDRRKISYSFGSPEWLAFMQDNNLECPKEDRRKVIRREEDQEHPLEALDTKTTQQRIFLTAGERRLLQDIYLTDFDDVE